MAAKTELAPADIHAARIRKINSLNNVPAKTKLVSTDISAARIAEINSLHKNLVKTLKKGAMIAFEIGKELRDIWGRLDTLDSWPQWCKDNLVFDVSTANRYLRIYNNFKDNPKQLSGQTFSGTLKLLSAPPKEEKQEIIRYGDESRRPETPWERYFEAPPLGRKVKLNNYRFEQPNENELYLIRRGFNYPVKIAEVLAPGSGDGRLKTAHRGMMENVQVALETYFEEAERVEELQKGGLK
jgi:hypothetical protein